MYMLLWQDMRAFSMFVHFFFYFRSSFGNKDGNELQFFFIYASLRCPLTSWSFSFPLPPRPSFHLPVILLTLVEPTVSVCVNCLCFGVYEML